LPKILEKTYQEILAAIQEQDGIGPKIADRAFKWVMAAYKPLTAEQLLAAALQDSDRLEPNRVPSGFDIEFVLKACRNLLVVDTILDHGQETTTLCRFALCLYRNFWKIETAMFK